MRLLACALSKRFAVVVEVCATCEGRAQKRGAGTLKAELKSALEGARVLPRCQVLSAGCLSRCPLDGVTVRIDHDPREWTRAQTFVVDDSAPNRAARTRDVVRTVVSLVEERRVACGARPR
jgi:hypothetical protein